MGFRMTRDFPLVRWHDTIQVWYLTHRVSNTWSSSWIRNMKNENNKWWGHFEARAKSWNMSLSPPWSLMTAGRLTFPMQLLWQRALNKEKFGNSHDDKTFENITANKEVQNEERAPKHCNNKGKISRKPMLKFCSLWIQCWKKALCLPKTRKVQKNISWAAQVTGWKDFAADFEVSKVCHQIAP